MNTQALRYTALRLATLHPADRSWLLERLPIPMADALRTLGAAPGIDRLARVVRDIPAPIPDADVPAPQPAGAVHRFPADGIDGEDPHWASLWRHAVDPDAAGRRLPAKLAAALVRWAPDEEAVS